MKTLLINIEINGTMRFVGTISGNDSSDAVFRYSEEYMNDSDTAPISLNLPFQITAFTAEQTRNYFDSLLPEGFTRRSVAEWLRVDENDYTAILHGLGRECLGAILVSEEGESVDASYEKVSTEQIKDLAAEGAVVSTELVVKSHMSLTGASGKVGLYYDEKDDSWYMPLGTAPSTHIVKQSHVRYKNIVTNEQLCLLIAQKCGIDVPQSFIINIGKGSDSDVLLASKRYDRVLTEKSKAIDGHPCPLRLHQEDFAQAMGIPASQKYEHGSGNYMKKMFDILRLYSSDPVADQIKLWDLIVFNYLIGNTDAHIKNYSLLYSADLKSKRLAPAYDIVSTLVYENTSRDMAFSIGGELSINRVSEESFVKAAKEVGLGERMAMNRFKNMQKIFPDALEQSAAELFAAGYSKARGIKEEILQHGGIGTL